MSAPYTGGCLCGAVRLRISSEPVTVLSCFCEHCSKGAGGTNQIIAKFEAGNVEITADEETIGEYSLVDTSSGNLKTKTFCRTCGCPLWTVPASARGASYLVRTALLAGGLEMRPQNEIFVKNRPAWMGNAKGVPQWDEMRK